MDLVALHAFSYFHLAYALLLSKARCGSLFGMQVWMQWAHELLQLPCLVPVTQSAPIVEKACKAVLDKFRSAPYSIPAQTGKVFSREWCSACMLLLI